MTNYQGSDKDIWLIKDFTSAAQNAFLVRLIETYVGATWGLDACGYACSDHASWHRAGVPASMPFEARFKDMQQADPHARGHARDQRQQRAARGQVRAARRRLRDRARQGRARPAGRAAIGRARRTRGQRLGIRRWHALVALPRARLRAGGGGLRGGAATRALAVKAHQQAYPNTSRSPRPTRSTRLPPRS